MAPALVQVVSVARYVHRLPSEASCGELRTVMK